MEKAFISGNVGQDAIIKNFNGNDFTSFSVAVNKSYKKADGTKVERTNWWSVLYKNTAIAPYIKKGMTITVMGETNHKADRDQNGNIVVYHNLNANDVTLGHQSSGNTQQNPSPATQQTSAPRTHPSVNQPNSTIPEAQVVGDGDDDLPF